MQKPLPWEIYPGPELKLWGIVGGMKNTSGKILLPTNFFEPLVLGLFLTEYDINDPHRPENKLLEAHRRVVETILKDEAAGKLDEVASILMDHLTAYLIYLGGGFPLPESFADHAVHEVLMSPTWSKVGGPVEVIKIDRVRFAHGGRNFAYPVVVFNAFWDKPAGQKYAMRVATLDQGGNIVK